MLRVSKEFADTARVVADETGLTVSDATTIIARTAKKGQRTWAVV
jgi:antitoxin component of RelBE/YafQ-DinJ toxin-antitoxin module